MLALAHTRISLIDTPYFLLQSWHNRRAAQHIFCPLNTHLGIMTLHPFDEFSNHFLLQWLTTNEQSPSELLMQKLHNPHQTFVCNLLQ